MPFTGNEDHQISLEDAAKATKRYRDSISAGTTLGAFYGKNALLAILNQATCVGLRIYYAKSEDGAPQFVLAGVTTDGDDLTDGNLAEFGYGCPPDCSKPNALNS